MRPFTIASVSRSMFEYADCVGVSVFDANATGLLSCTSPLISSIAKLAMCNPWSRSASNYSEIFSDNNGRGTLYPSGIGNKWKANVYML